MFSYDTPVPSYVYLLASISMTPIDLADFKLAGGMPDTTRKSPTKVDRRFLKGPIPWVWITRASRLPGCALQLALAIWFRAGVEKSATVSVTSTLLREMGVNRHAKYRALKTLEGAGLVQVTRRHGKNPQVTLVLQHQ